MILDDITALTRWVFGEKLTGVYLHGSMAFGCYNPQKSDIDLIVAVNSPVSAEEKVEYVTGLVELESCADSPKKGIEMSVVREDICRSFVYPTPFELHYSDAHKERFLAAPEKFCENMRGMDKDLAAHFTVIKAVGRTLCGKPIEEVFGEVKREYYLDSIMYDVAGAARDIAADPIYAVLNLCRTAAFVREGKVLSKADGAMWAAENIPKKYLNAVSAAAESYRSGSAFTKDISAEALREFAEYMLAEIGRG
ncbi:MAG: DUF4111 domain-containing protein [Oscillospiraceae bacterium]|nr:DUF4111 domain-containing protein [Oscillospiraceae bacterium]